jgi:hypothetical protein
MKIVNVCSPGFRVMVAAPEFEMGMEEARMLLCVLREDFCFILFSVRQSLGAAYTRSPGGFKHRGVPRLCW